MYLSYCLFLLLVLPLYCFVYIIYLQHLVNIFELELAALDMLTNAKKSCCLRIGPRHNKECSNNITTASGHIIPWVDTIRYLGIYITLA